MPAKKPLCLNISCLSFNGDGSQVALSPNTNQVEIWETNGSDDVKSWKKLHTLEEHVGYVSGIDWCAQTNLIATCGHDRNAYVWKFDDASKEWKPTLVILRINRAATSVKWSPLGNKFAVGSGAKCVPVCHFEESNDWWISKMIKKHKSTVTSIAWCPNNKFIVTGGCDFKARIFSAYIENIDSAEDDGFGEVFPNQHDFGEVLAEFDQTLAWVNNVAWSPGGFRVAFSGHGSTIHFAQLLAGSPPQVQTHRLRGLPFLDMQFLDDNRLVAVGYDNNPTLFSASGSDADPEWALTKKIDEEKGVEKKAKSGVSAAFAKFQNTAKKGDESTGDTSLKTVHQNTVTEVHLLEDKKQIATTGIDGRVVFWAYP